MTLRLTGILTLLTIIAAHTALAQNTMFLRKSPIADLDEQDRTLLRETIDKLLDSPDGTILDWSNPDTGNGGRVKVLDTNETSGMTCRTIRARNQARGRQADGLYQLCKDQDGAWKFARAGKRTQPGNIAPENEPETGQ